MRAGARCCNASGRSCFSPPAMSSRPRLPPNCADARTASRRSTRIAETGIGAHISLLSGRAASSQHTLGASKSYSFESDFIFQPRVFMELQNAQAIALPYDGLNPLPPQYLLPEAALPGRPNQLLRPPCARGAVSSLDRILPFLKPIEDLLVDPDVTEVMVNEGGRRVFVERDGPLEPVPGRTLESRNLTVAIKNIARACGDEISEMQPLLDARLEDGSRVAAMFPPCAVGGPVLTIRKFTRRFTLDDLVDIGTLTRGHGRVSSEPPSTSSGTS